MLVLQDLPEARQDVNAASRHEIIQLLQGDHNQGDDRLLYNRGQRWLNASHIMGRVVAYLPYAGRATIIMNDYPAAKYGLIGLLGLFVMTSKE